MPKTNKVKVQPHEVIDFPLSTLVINEEWMKIINAGS